jgi:mannosyltransferase
MTDLRTDGGRGPASTGPSVRRPADGPRGGRPSGPLGRFHHRRWGDAWLIGLLGFLLALPLAGQPSVWYDEAATVVSATRDWDALARMLSTVDAVHGLYYALMHVWFDLVGYSPTSLRFPSAVFVGLAAAGVVLLTRTVSTRATGVVAGICFVVIPRSAWMGTEGRSFALGTLIAVALTVVLVLAARRAGSPPRVQAAWWALYGLIAWFGASTFIYLALLVGAHGAVILWAVASARVGRRTVRPMIVSLLGWGIASISAGLLSLPLVDVVTAQSGQVGWIKPIGPKTPGQVAFTQLFPENAAFAWVAWPLALLGLAMLVRRGIRLVRARRASTAEPTGEMAAFESAYLHAGWSPTLLQLAVVWLVVPTTLLVYGSTLTSPLYSPRYLAYTAPAFAMLMAVGILALRWKPAVAVVTAGLVVLSLVQVAHDRGTTRKADADWAAISRIVTAERAQEAPGTSEAVIFGPVRRHPKATSRIVAYSYPDAFRGMDDILLRTPPGDTDGLWEKAYPLADRVDEVDGADVVWLVTSDKQDIRPEVAEALTPRGFAKTDDWHVKNANVERYERVAAG